MMVFSVTVGRGAVCTTGWWRCRLLCSTVPLQASLDVPGLDDVCTVYPFLVLAWLGVERSRNGLASFYLSAVKSSYSHARSVITRDCRACIAQLFDDGDSYY